MALIGGGTDAELNVGIHADPAEAARKLEEAFERAITNALKAPGVQTAFTKLIQKAARGADKIGETIGKELKGVVKETNKTGAKMEGVFRKVNKVAGESLNSFGTNLKSSERGVKLLDSNIEALTRDMGLLAQSQKDVVRLASALEASIRKEADLRSRNFRTEQKEAQAASRANTALLQFQSSEVRRSAQTRVATIRAMSRQIIQIERSILRVVELTWKSAERAVRAFARGASAVIRSFVSTASAAFRGLGRGLATAFTGIGKSLSAVFRGMASTVRAGFSRQNSEYRTGLSRNERALNSSLQRQSASIQRFQTQFSRGLAGVLSGRGALGLGAGVAGGFGIGSLLTSGFERAGQQEQLQLTFTTLLGNAGKAETVLSSLSQFARTTAFDFVEVAGSVAQLTAALGDVDQAVDLTKFLADVTALTGGTTEALAHVRLAMSQIASAGKLDASNLRQLTEALPGIPFAQILADKFFGGDLAAFSAARDAGELGGTISSQAFFDAFEEGVNERFPDVEGFAVRAAGTLTGLAANLKENFAIFGATIINLFEGPIKSAIQGVNNLLGELGNFVTGVQEVTGVSIQGGGLLGVGLPGEETTLVPLTGHLKLLRDILGNVGKALGAFLALKGVVELFKFLGLAIRAALTPLGLFVLAVSAITGAFSLFTRFSEKFASTWKVMTFQIPFLGRAFQQLGRSIVHFFSGSGIGGNKVSIITKIGDAFRWVNVWVARVLVKLREFINVAALAFETGDFFGLGQWITNQFASALNIDPATLGGGNDFLNLLEQTFLGPIVRFFRGPFLDGIEGLGDVFGDIFDIIFGGGQEGAGARFRGEEGGGGSIATKILNRLEDTFLGPIIRFFRGPFADIIEGIGGGIADFGGFLGDIFTAIFGDAQGGIGTRILNVLEDTFLGPVVRFFRGTFADGVEAVASFAVDAFRSIVDGIQEFLSLIEPLTDAIGHFFKNLFGGAEAPSGKFDFGGEEGGLSGIWEGLQTSIGDVGAKVTEILGPVWTAITDWFANTFSPVNVIGVAKDVGNIIRELGRVLGLIVSDPIFVGALAVLAVSLVLAIGAALLGAFQGVIENADRWGDIIVGGINAALGGILPDSITDNGVIATAIGAALSLALGAGLVKALAMGYKAGGGGKLATETFSFGRLGLSIAQSLLGSIGREFKALWQGGRYLFTGKALATGENATFQGIGQKIGGGILAGIGIAFAGYQIGSSVGGTGGILLGILTGAVTGASIGAVIGGGVVGAAVGGTLGAALGGISALFGQNAQKAEEARDRVREYADALEGLSGPELQLTGTSTFLDAVIADLQDNQRALQAIADAGLPAADLFASIDTAGLSEFNDLLIPFIDRIGEIEGVSPEAASAFDALMGSIGEVPTVISDLGELEHALDFLQDQGLLSGDQVDALKAAFDQLGDAGIDLDEIISVLFKNADATDTALSFNDLRTQIKLVGDAATKALASKDAGGLVQSLEGVVPTVAELQGAVNDAQSALENLLNVNTYGGSFQALHDEVQLALSGLPEVISSGLEGVAPEDVQATLRQIVRPIGDSFAGELAQAMEEGFVTNVPQLDAFQAQLSADIRALHLDPAVEAMLLAAVEGLDTPEIRAALEAKANAVQTTLAAALTPTPGSGTGPGKFYGVGAVAVPIVVAGFRGAAGAARPQFQAIGADVATQIAEGITSSKHISSAVGAELAGTFTAKKAPDTKKTPGPSVDDKGVEEARKITAQINAILIAGSIKAALAGAAIGQAITRGITTGGRQAGAAGAAIAFVAANAANAFVGAAVNAGRNIGQGLARGIASMASSVAQAAAAIALIAVIAARRVLQSHSPSVVFQNIGRDIGKGFIQGIKDSEGDMIDAISEAIQNAVEAGAQRAGKAIARAQVGQTIFDNLQPSILPGGTTNASLTNSRAALTQGVAGLADALQQNISGGLFNDDAQAGFRSSLDIQGFVLELRQGLIDTRSEYNQAIQAQRDLASFDAKRAALERGRASGSLGYAELTKQIKELKKQLAEGSMTAEEYAKKSATLVAQYRAGTLNADAYAEAIKELGSRPAALTLSQFSLIGSGPTSLNPGTIAGKANTASITDALQRIQEFAQAQIEAGQPLDAVIARTEAYVDALRVQAKAAGLSSAAVELLITGMGLTDAALNSFRNQVLSLNTGTISGAANVAAINEQLQAIRDYGSELIAAGFSTDTVTVQLRNYRAQLIAQATALGFNLAQINALVTAAGLSDSALNTFVTQLQNFDREARNAAAVAQQAAQAAKEKAAAEAAEAAAAGQSPGISTRALDRPVIEGDMIINLPTGDPEANALAVLNRLSYGR